jgi:hypothetical protein
MNKQGSHDFTQIENPRVCFSDRIKLYIDFIISKIECMPCSHKLCTRDYCYIKPDRDFGHFRKCCYELYSYIRGDESIMNGRSPRGFAAGIIYTICLITKTYLSQKQVGDLLNISDATVGRYCYLISDHLWHGRIPNSFGK